MSASETIETTTVEARTGEAAVGGRSRRTGVLIGGLFFVVALLSAGNFGPSLVDPDRNDLVQQAVVEVFWIGIVLLALPWARLDRFVWDRRVGAVAALVLWAALTAFWSATPSSSLLKGGALVFNCFAVFLLFSTLRFATVVDLLVAALGLLDLVSVVLVVAVPDVGVVQEWQHQGQWIGVFEQKQTFGILSAILLYLAVMQFAARRERRWRLYHLAVAGLAFVCMLGSGSRGGAALAFGAVMLGLFAGRDRTVGRLAALIPPLALAVSAAFLTMLVVTDREVLTFGDVDVDFTDRTRIWKHALDYLSDGNLLFGSGLNGFWSRKEVADAFLGGHGWFLDNYHDGLLAILGDCGLVGVALFLALTLALATSDFGPAESREHAEKVLSIGFLALFYVIGVTETYVLRSTNLTSLMFFFFVFRLLSADPGPPASPVEGDVKRVGERMSPVEGDAKGGGAGGSPVSGGTTTPVERAPRAIP